MYKYNFTLQQMYFKTIIKEFNIFKTTPFIVANIQKIRMTRQ